MEEFIDIFFNNLPFPPNLIHLASSELTAFQQQLSQQLHPASSVNLNYNFTEFVSNLTSSLIDVFINAIPYPAQPKQCLSNLLHDNISPDVISKVGGDLKQIQLLYQTLKKLDTFVKGLRIEESFGYHPQEQCISAIISQSYLRCQRNLPNLCSSACSNAVVGCQSSLNDGLLPQFEGLWQVARDVIQSTLITVNRTLRIDEPMLLTHEILFQILVSIIIYNYPLSLSPSFCYRYQGLNQIVVLILQHCFLATDGVETLTLCSQNL